MVDAGCWRHATFDASVSSFVPETSFHEWSSLKPPPNQVAEPTQLRFDKRQRLLGPQYSQSRPAQWPWERDR
jgi:hypothetical protein